MLNPKNPKTQRSRDFHSKPQPADPVPGERAPDPLGPTLRNPTLQNSNPGRGGPTLRGPTLQTLILGLALLWLKLGPPSAGPPSLPPLDPTPYPATVSLLFVSLSGRLLKCARLGPRNVHVWVLEGPGASNTTKIPREDTQRERQKERKWSGRGKKKARNFGSPTLRDSAATCLGQTASDQFV